MVEPASDAAALHTPQLEISRDSQSSPEAASSQPFAQSQEAAAVDGLSETAGHDGPRLRRRALVTGAAAIVLAGVAAAGGWWYLQSPDAASSQMVVKDVDTERQSALPSTQDSKSTSQPVEVQGRETAVTQEQEAEPDDAAAVAAAERARVAALRRQEADRRQRETRAQAQAVAQEEARRVAEMAARQQAAQAAQQAQQAQQAAARAAAQAQQVSKARLPSPQQACADKANFIGRAICESLECARPEHAQTPYCVKMRATQDASNNDDLYGN